MIYKPKSKLEKFGEKIYFLLVDNFSQTFFVGGMVRDLLFGKVVTDIDIATEATPSQVVNILSAHKINFNNSNHRYGITVAAQGDFKIEIATFRKDFYSKDRYPKISFVKRSQIDSQRRDFSINSLYLSSKTNKILDYHKGLADIKAKRLKFIGNPQKRITEDPLRIIRALRFALDLNLSLDKKTFLAIKNNFHKIKLLTNNKILTELKKIKNKNNVVVIKKVLLNAKLLDKYFKPS